MAKALFSVSTGSDPRVTSRLATENRVLRQRVADLEAVVLRLQMDNDEMTASLKTDQDVLAHA